MTSNTLASEHDLEQLYLSRTDGTPYVTARQLHAIEETEGLRRYPLTTLERTAPLCLPRTLTALGIALTTWLSEVVGDPVAEAERTVALAAREQERGRRLLERSIAALDAPTGRQPRRSRVDHAWRGHMLSYWNSGRGIRRWG